MLIADLTDGTDIVFLLKKQNTQTRMPQSAKRIAANIRISATDFALIPHAAYPILTQGKRLPHRAITIKERIIVYISENYFDGNITNTSLAELCGISTVYFRKTFKSVYGISPIKYLHDFRIKKAKAILLSDYESIEQVALSVGYNSIYHFSKMFKTYTGTNPSEYGNSPRK